MIMNKYDLESTGTAVSILKEIDLIFDINMSASHAAIERIANHIYDQSQHSVYLLEMKDDQIKAMEYQIEWACKYIERLEIAADEVQNFRIHMLDKRNDETFKQLNTAVIKVGDLTRKNIDDSKQIDKLKIDVYRLEEVKKTLSDKHNGGYKKGYVEALRFGETAMQSYKTMRGALARIRKEIKIRGKS